VSFQHLSELVLHQGHALNQGTSLARLLGGRHGALQVVQNRQQRASHVKVPIAPFFLAFAAITLLVILEIRLAALQQGQVLVALFRLGAEGFKVFVRNSGDVFHPCRWVAHGFFSSSDSGAKKLLSFSRKLLRWGDTCFWSSSASSRNGP